MPQIDITTYVPILFWILLILVAFFKFLISEGTLNFLNLPKLQGSFIISLCIKIRTRANLLAGSGNSSSASDKGAALLSAFIFSKNIAIADPLEQFDIILFKTSFLTNLTIFFFFILFFIYLNFKIKDTFILYNKNIAIFLIFDAIKSLVQDNLHIKKFYIFFYVCSLFLIILICNCVGMIPYTFTVTSSLIVTFFMAAMFFGGANIIGVFTHGWKALSLFIPSGVPVAIMPFLVLIEIISYFSRVISLSVRLFANMMSGHTLLKILLVFFWLFLKNLTNMLPLLETFVELLPWLIIIMVTLLECAIAYLQAYVFTVLIAIYLNDCINLH